MKNYAGKSGEELDVAIIAELEEAGIEAHQMSFKQTGEVGTTVIGTLHGWLFKRAWYYWTAEGPGIPADIAMELWDADAQKVVRVDGHCAAPSPLEWFKGFAVGHYHVDSQEGLKLLVNALNETARRGSERSIPVANNAVG